MFADVEAVIASLRETLSKVKASMEKAQQTANGAFETAQKQQEKPHVTEKEIKRLRDQVEGQENRNRRQNLRRRNFGEGEKKRRIQRYRYETAK